MQTETWSRPAIAGIPPYCSRFPADTGPAAVRQHAGQVVPGTMERSHGASDETPGAGMDHVQPLLLFVHGAAPAPHPAADVPELGRGQAMVHGDEPPGPCLVGG